MKNRYYLTDVGILQKKDDTLYFKQGNTKTPIPVNKVYDLFASENVTVKSGVFRLLEDKNILLHIFSYGGKYLGTFKPPEKLKSGTVITKQAKFYNEKSKRISLAKKIVKGSIKNRRNLLDRYDGLTNEITKELESILNKINKVHSIPRIMELEGKGQMFYYEGINNCLSYKTFEFETRTRQPPEDKTNALISYLNSVLYGAIVTELYHTRLNQTISFLHEPQERRYSLSLDLADIFKPIITDRVIISAINQNKLDSIKHFEEKGSSVLLSEEGREVILKEFENKTSTTRLHPDRDDKVRFRRWPRLEGYKITKHLIGTSEYQPTVIN